MSDQESSDPADNIAAQLARAATKMIRERCIELGIGRGNTLSDEHFQILTDTYMILFATGIGAVSIAYMVSDEQMERYLNAHYKLLTEAIIHARESLKQEINN